MKPFATTQHTLWRAPRVAAKAAALAAAAFSLSLAVPGTAHAVSFRVLAPPMHVLNRSARPGSIIRINSQPPTGMYFPFLMTDGSVLVQSTTLNTWYVYRPDNTGSYVNGTWTQVGTLPYGYQPDAFSSAVLADGRLLISGGEYNTPGQYDLQLVNLGAYYDPHTTQWTSIGHPKGWQYIGDSPNSILPNGQFLIGQKLTKRTAIFDPATNKYSNAVSMGKKDFNAEEGYTLLPDGTILTADVRKAPNSEIYTPSTGQWKTAGSTIQDLREVGSGGCYVYGPKPGDCYYAPGEIGPSILRPDGTVFYTGGASGGSANGVGHTSIYHFSGSLAGQWTAGPDFPSGDSAGDSFAILEPSGNVIVFGVSGEMWEWNGSSLNGVGSVQGFPLLLPTGQIMMVGYQVALYTPTGQPNPAWAPTVTNVQTSLSRGKTYRVTGTQFNGLSQAMSFGDEFQNATNYPLVRLTNYSTNHVFYAMTHDHSTMGVATGSKKVFTNFDVPKSMETGKTMLQVVANGIASTPVMVTIQ